MRRLSIRQKLLGLIVLVIAGPLLAGFGVVLRHDAETFRREVVEGATLVARVVGEYTVPDLTFEDREAAASSLGKLAAVPAVRSAMLFDAAGRPFTSWGERLAAPPNIEPAPRVHLAADGLHVVEPIVYRGERYGTLYLLASTAPLQAKIARHALVLGAVSVATLALALALAWRLQRVVSEPILELAETTRRVTLTGDTSLRATKRAEDEVGVLCDGFNDMLEQLGRRVQERDAAELRTQEKSRFLANMSHELRTPLNSIIGFSEILLSRAADHLDPRERRFLGNIHSSGKHLLAIINDILDLSKVEAGRMELQPEPVALGALIDGVSTVMKGVAEGDGISFDIELREDLPTIWADPIKVKQILYNLLSNAVKFSPAGSRVGIAARSLSAAESPLGEHVVEIVVTDQGIGIAPEDHQRIFAPFQQLDATAGRRFGGTGLGLALVKTFAEMHGGRVVVDSTLGRGSRFAVLLPVRSTRVRQAGTPSAAPTVLVVEDESSVYEQLWPKLEAAGFDPVAAKNGEAALALARSVRPAAVILDLVLPGMVDGWEVLRSLKAVPETAGLPVVIYTRQHDRELGMALGADDYFLKPMDLGRLAQRVRELVAGSERAARPTVLIIDDDRGIHQLVGGGLVAEGYEVVHAYSASDGLLRARTTPPALVVIDLLMEQGEGLGVALELRSRPETARLPVVVLGGHDPSDEERLLLRGKALELIDPGGGEAVLAGLRRLLHGGAEPADPAGE